MLYVNHTAETCKHFLKQKHNLSAKSAVRAWLEEHNWGHDLSKMLTANIPTHAHLYLHFSYFLLPIIAPKWMSFLVQGRKMQPLLMKIHFCFCWQKKKFESRHTLRHRSCINVMLARWCISSLLCTKVCQTETPEDKIMSLWFLDFAH